ncbi:MAG: hypothetical protein HYX68_05425 [Planctomycetes bacterium]|jgi:uncharacterized protein (DUF2141 family)|nr:hypothetical protein [Planctomycetota bacterium]
MGRLLMIPFVFVVCLFLVAEGAGQDKKKKKKGLPVVVGKLTNIEAGKDAGTGTITVTTAAKKKKDVVIAEAKEHKFEVTKETKIQKASGKKKEAPADAAFSDLEKGQTLAVTHDAGKATKVVILPGKKKKKKTS